MRIIGLTGPIAAGKDEVAKILKHRGAYIINADEAAHTLYKPQSPLWHELVKVFGSKILIRGGKINRKKLGEIVFGDRKKLAELNRIVHPYLREAIVKRSENQKSEREKQKTGIRDQLIVINAAVLKEIGLVGYVDKVWVVTAPRAVRLGRLVGSGLSEAEARRRINAQAPQKDYLSIADRVIKNDGNRAALSRKILGLLNE